MASFFTKSEPPKKRPFRVLTLDGGGVRAIIQSTILCRLVHHFPTLLSEIDMFAGTSAGSIVAGALAIGVSPEQTSELWTEEVARIFTEGYLHKFGTMDNVIGAAYNSVELEKMLTKMIGKKTLSDLKPKFLAPSFKLDTTVDNAVKNPRWQPVFFHNFEHSDNSDTPLVEVILRSAAAPTYFPIRNGFIDGGTFANNPAMAAITTAIAGGIGTEDMSVLSISTGINPQCIPASKIGSGNWGLYEWGPYLINLLLDSTTQSIDYECKCILKDRYKRLDPLIPTNVGLDDATAVPSLVKLANALDISDIIAWIETYWGIKQMNEGEKPMELENPPAGWKCIVQ